MRFKSLLAVGVLASGLLTSPLTATAAPTTVQATTAGTCSMVMPARFSIRAAVTNFKITLAQNCRTASMSGADWLGSTTGSTWQDYLLFSNDTYSDTLTMYALSTPVGRTTWVGTGAYDTDFNDIAMANPAGFLWRTARSGQAPAASGDEGAAVLSD